jgi:hypothetical protein
LKAEWKKPGSFLLATTGPTDEVRSIINPKANHDPKSDGELLQTN